MKRLLALTLIACLLAIVPVATVRSTPITMENPCFSWDQSPECVAMTYMCGADPWSCYGMTWEEFYSWFLSMDYRAVDPALEQWMRDKAAAETLMEISFATGIGLEALGGFYAAMYAAYSSGDAAWLAVARLVAASPYDWPALFVFGTTAFVSYGVIEFFVDTEVRAKAGQAAYEICSDPANAVLCAAYTGIPPY